MQYNVIKKVTYNIAGNDMTLHLNKCMLLEASTCIILRISVNCVHWLRRVGRKQVAHM